MKWLLNDLLVSKLANSKRFQYIVLNIDTFFTKSKTTIVEKGKVSLNIVKDKSQNIHKTDFKKMIEEFQRDLKKEIENTEMKKGIKTEKLK